ncbi:hypothetical protein N7G274_006556 [Stereocaulon virgatum]|uniref:Ankyrin n=1 Tax=Stereocaulon virgatum TaxID=373712 RepID=A0ABR4A867_9LECA
MDPLSIAASSVTVAALAASTCSTFSELRSFCRSLPDRLHALNNEVVDTEIVLAQLATLFGKRTSLIEEAEQQVTLELLSQASVALNQLQDIVKGFAALRDRSKFILIQASAWRKEQSNLERIQAELKRVKCTLGIMLGASNSCDMLRIRLHIEQISTITSHFSSQTAQERTLLREEILSGLASHRDGVLDHLNQVYRQLDERIAGVEGVLKAQADEARPSPLRLMRVSQKPRSTTREWKLQCTPRIPMTENSTCTRSGVRARLNRYTSTCSAACDCICHTTMRVSTPAMIDRVLGQLFIGYAGLPLLNPKCDAEGCSKSRTPWISLEYWFPVSYFWSQIFCLQVAYRKNFGPQVSLSTLRRVPNSALCIKYALTGNIEGLKTLFTRGLASPTDVCSVRGYSLLRWASWANQFSTCRFLVHAGADPYHRPTLRRDCSPEARVSELILQNRLSQEDIEVLSCVLQVSDFIDEQGYSQIHRVVLGLSMASLEEVIAMHPGDINVVDAVGRTPLIWAASRGEGRAVALLLEAGADPDVFDIYGNGAVTYAAEGDHSVCVRLLLEANAELIPVLPTGVKLLGAVNHTTRYASKVSSLKQLLDAGAEVEPSTVEGWTPLINAARLDKVDFARLLLDYGADINATSTLGQTPLTTAITYNSHNILRLLLDQWRKFSTCPRRLGPNLLQIAALHADIETINILTASEHLNSRSDRICIVGDFETRLHERLDVTDELVARFEELVTIIGREPNTYEAIQSQSDLEHLTSSAQSMVFEESGTPAPESHDNKAEDVFVDALEEPEKDCDV